MEKTDYRETLEWLKEQFGGKVLLSVSDVAAAFGCDRRTAKSRYPFKDCKIEITRLASYLCLSSQEIRRSYRCPS